MPSRLGAVEAGEAQAQGAAPAPEQGAVERRVGDAVGGVAEDEGPDSGAEPGRGDAGDGGGDEGEGVGPGENAELQVAAELGLGGLGGGAEEVEGGEDGQRRGDAAAVVAVHEENGEAHRGQGPQGAEAAVEHEVGGRQLVDPLVFVQQGVVEAEVAQGDHQGEQGGGQGHVAEVLRGQGAGEDDDGDPVDQAPGVGAAQGVDRAARHPGQRHPSLPCVDCKFSCPAFPVWSWG